MKVLGVFGQSTHTFMKAVENVFHDADLLIVLPGKASACRYF